MSGEVNQISGSGNFSFNPSFKVLHFLNCNCCDLENPPGYYHISTVFEQL